MFISEDFSVTFNEYQNRYSKYCDKNVKPVSLSSFIFYKTCLYFQNYNINTSFEFIEASH